VIFSNNSLISDFQNCAEVLTYGISAQIFKGFQPVRLAAYFASFETIPSYTVKNSHQGAIGQVIGDGLIISTDVDLTNVLICINIDIPPSEKQYTVYDFATSDNAYSFVTPLGITAYTTETSQLCAVINPKEGSSTYIPIKRVSNWDSIKHSYFSNSSKSLIYALGAFYIFVALFAFLQLTGVVVLLITGKMKSLSISVLVTFTIFVFTIIRAIYFFIVPSGSLSNKGSVAEYTLIVFPTFPYFTAFSCIPLVWAVLTGSVRKTGAMSKVYKTVAAVNIILYIVFIIIVVVFNETKTISHNQCIGEWESTQLTQGQKAISIVYSVIISAISLAIALSFIIFGRKIMIVSGSQSDVVNKTFRTAAICSFGFMLNCLFILIITGARLNSVGFSFAGLIISELIPSMFMLSTFGVFNTIKSAITGQTTKSGISGSTSSTVSVNSTTGNSSSSVSASSGASSSGDV